jgi:hypothetical protein
MTFSSGSDTRFGFEAFAETSNGPMAMLGIVIGVPTEAHTGAGIAHQIGLGPLVDGYAACRTQFLPFCF